jgi:hypothetical protein
LILQTRTQCYIRRLQPRITFQLHANACHAMHFQSMLKKRNDRKTKPLL